jgi:hypothetical protein
MTTEFAINPSWPRGMREPIAAAYVGGRENLRRLCSVTGLRPVIQGKRNTTYDRAMIDTAMDTAGAIGWKESA